MKDEFTEWKYMGNIKNTNDKVPNDSGVYILHTIRKYISSPYGTDENGILYIGKSKNLRNRLRVSAKPKFKTWYNKNPKLTFNHSSLTFTTNFDDNYNLALHHPCIDNGYLERDTLIGLHHKKFKNPDKIERTLLHGHVMKFGQLPPFNFIGVSLKKVWE